MKDTIDREKKGILKMWNKIRAALHKEEAKDSKALSNAEAVAAILVYTAKLDEDYGTEERAHILELLARQQWDSTTSAEDLLARAEELCSEAVGYYGFLRVVNADFEDEDRAELLAMMWGVVMVDGVVDDYEANMMRRITGLLGLSDIESGRIRREVTGSL